MQCELCLNSWNHPFGNPLHESECRVCLNKNAVDIKLFQRLLNKLQVKKKSRYHCLVLLKGSPEDFFVVKKLTDNNIYPLCVFVNSYLSSNVAWQNVHSLIHKFDLELHTFNPNPAIYKRLVKYSFRRFQDVLTPYKMLQYTYTYKLASELQVEFIISGENQVQTNIKKYTDQAVVTNTPWAVYEHDVHTSRNDFFGPSLDLSYKQVASYDPMPITNGLVQWYFLSDFLPWNQFEQDKGMVKYGARGQFQESTFDYFHRAGSSVFYEIHDILRFYKFHSIKVDDQLSREIRRGSIEKKDALVLSDYYKSKLFSARSINQNISDFFAWLELDKDSAQWYIKNRLDIKFNFVESSIGEHLHNNLLDHLYGSDISGVEHKKKDFCVYEKGI